MDLTSPKTIKELLAKYDANPLKTMGQNFLIDKPALNKIIEASDLNSNDIVLEIGPGIGTLTQELAKRVKKVIAVEKDQAMVQILKETLKDRNNVEIIQGDILKLETIPYTLYPKPCKIVSNIPYYLTSPLIRMFLESKNPPNVMVLMVQKEVAQRICAKSPSPPYQNSKRTSGVGASLHKMSILAVSVQFYADPKIISHVSKECFWPSPKVDSAIIKIIPLKEKSQINAETFFKVVKAGFSHPRKQLAGNLSKALKIEKNKITEWLLQNNIQPTQRAETLSLSNWKDLANSL